MAMSIPRFVNWNDNNNDFDSIIMNQSGAHSLLRQRKTAHVLDDDTTCVVAVRDEEDASPAPSPSLCTCQQFIQRSLSDNSVDNDDKEAEKRKHKKKKEKETKKREKRDKKEKEKKKSKRAKSDKKTTRKLRRSREQLQQLPGNSGGGGGSERRPRSPTLVAQAIAHSAPSSPQHGTTTSAALRARYTTSAPIATTKRRTSAPGPQTSDKEALTTSWQDLDNAIHSQRGISLKMQRSKQNATVRAHLNQIAIVFGIGLLALQLLPFFMSVLTGTGQYPGIANRQPLTLVASYQYQWETDAPATSPRDDGITSADDIQLLPYVKAAFSPNSQRHVILTDQKRVVEVDLFEGAGIQREIGAGLLEHPEDVAASDTGYIFVLDTAQEIVRVFNATTSAHSHDILAPKCQSMAVVRGTGSIVLADMDGRVRVFKQFNCQATGSLCHSIELSFEIPGCNNRKCAHHRAVDSDGKVLVVAYYDHVHVFDATTGRSVGVITKDSRSYLQPQVALLPGTQTALMNHNRQHMLYTLSLNSNLVHSESVITETVAPLPVYRGKGDNANYDLDVFKTELYDVATDSAGSAIVVTSKGRVHVLQVQYF